MNEKIFFSNNKRVNPLKGKQSNSLIDAHGSMYGSIENTVVPMVTDTSDQRSYDIYSRLLKDRIIFLNTDVNEVSAGLICAQLLALQAENREKPVQLYINSPGGCVYSCIMILNTMACVTFPVHTCVLGFAASAASIIATCGQRGKRSILQGARIMIHQPSGGFRGQATDAEIQVNEMIYLKNYLIDLYSERTMKNREEIKEKMERDYYMSANEALSLGLVDEIVLGSFDKKIL
jgi:ATP-dependent Clp protease protease subunit